MRNTLMLILLLFFVATTNISATVNLNYLQTCIKTHCFLSRIADTPPARARGLMGETYLPKKEGMLFIFPMEGYPSFWMKKPKYLWIFYLLMTKIPLFTLSKMLSPVMDEIAQSTKQLDAHQKYWKLTVA